MMALGARAAGLKDYGGDAFGDDFLPTDADYTDPDLRRAIDAKGWMIWPPLRYSYDTTVKDLDVHVTCSAKLA